MAHAVHEPEVREQDLAETQTATPEDTEKAPVHYEIKEYFSPGEHFLAGLLGVIAIAAGVICGLIFVNN